MSAPHEASGASAARSLPAGFATAHWAHFVALGFGSGLSPVAPGTAGTLMGWALYRILDRWITDIGWLMIVILGVILGVWVSQRVIDALKVHDHGAIVWDEIVAFWAVLVLVPGSAWQQAGLFLLFRLFDTVKPWPIGWLDRHVKGGWGVMVDDLGAAAATVIVALIWRSVG
ncbi:MAG: phosphatidylglycerophosphatase A [Burkholderiaceae bacterium]